MAIPAATTATTKSTASAVSAVTGALLESLPVAAYVCDADGVVHLWNRRCASVCGEPRAADRFNPGVWRQTPGGAPVTGSDHPVARAIAAGMPVCDREVLHERADGSSAWLLIHAEPLLDAQGRPAGATVVVSDITARRQADDALREKESLVSDFIENGAVGLHWVGPDGTILWANHAEMRMLGYGADEYIGHHIREFHADEQVICDILDRLARNETLDRYAARLRCKNGEIRYVAISSNVLMRDGVFVHTRCFTHDVTASRRAEDALRASEEQYRELAEKLPQLVWTTDAAGRFTFANRNWTEYTGLDLAASRDTNWRELVHADDYDHVMSSWAADFAKGEPYEVEFRMRRAADGAYRWYLIRAWPRRGADGAIEQWLGTSTDIHDLKSAQIEADLARERLRAIIDHAPVVLWTIDRDGTRAGASSATTTAC